MGLGDIGCRQWALFGERGHCLGVVGIVWGQGVLFGGKGHHLCVCVHVIVAGCCCGRCSCVWMVGLSWPPLGVCSYSFACLCLCHHGRWVLDTLVVGIDVAAGIIVIMDIVMGVVVVVVVVAIVVIVVVVVVAVSISRCVVVVVVVVEELVMVVMCHT